MTVRTQRWGWEMRRSDVQRRTAPHGGHRFPAVASGGSWQLAAASWSFDPDHSHHVG